MTEPNQQTKTKAKLTLVLYIGLFLIFIQYVAYGLFLSSFLLNLGFWQIIIVSVILGLALFHLSEWALKWHYKNHALRLSVRQSLWLAIFHFICLTASLCICILYIYFNNGLRGYYTEHIILLTTISSGIIYPFIANNTQLNDVMSQYFSLFSRIPQFLGIILLIPYCTLVLLIFIPDWINPVSRHIIYEDDYIRVQNKPTDILQGFVGYEVIQKGWLLVYNEGLVSPNCNSRPRVDKVGAIYTKDSVAITIYSANYQDTCTCKYLFKGNGP